jgi:hypothetical protein
MIGAQVTVGKMRPPRFAPAPNQMVELSPNTIFMPGGKDVASIVTLFLMHRRFGTGERATAEGRVGNENTATEADGNFGGTVAQYSDTSILSAGFFRSTDPAKERECPII